MATRTVNIIENIEKIRSRIDQAAQKVGRTAQDITLVAVTKGVSPDLIAQGQQAGLSVFGESKIQEATDKVPQIAAGWHLVGHLQTNKVKAALSLFSLIQSVDTFRLAKKISEESVAEQKETAILLEVNISGEAQKYGFKPEELYTALDAILQMPGLKILGLMGIAPFEAGEEATRNAFKTLKGIFTVCKGMKSENLEMKHLSMGMSDDFEIAIEEGSNMVRIGRALFK